MKKSILLSLFVSSVIMSCSISKKDEISDTEIVQVNTTVVLPGQVDTIPFNAGDTGLYNTYHVVHIKTGQHQMLTYGADFNMWSIEDSTKIRIIETVRYHVPWNEIQ